VVGTWARSVFWWSGGRGRNRRHRRERNRITALLPLWLLWLLRTTASAAVSTRMERLRVGEQLLLSVWPLQLAWLTNSKAHGLNTSNSSGVRYLGRAARGSAFRKATCGPLPVAFHTRSRLPTRALLSVFNSVAADCARFSTAIRPGDRHYSVSETNNRNRRATSLAAQTHSHSCAP
jgi:hypothetical protein